MRLQPFLHLLLPNQHRCPDRELSLSSPQRLHAVSACCLNLYLSQLYFYMIVTILACRVHGGTKVLPEGDRFFVKDDNVCREFFCKVNATHSNCYQNMRSSWFCDCLQDFYGDLSPQEVSPPHSCLTRYPCSHNLTELQRNISICCDQCSGEWV